MRIVISPRAQADLDAYAAYLGADDPAVGTRFLLAAAQMFASLAAHPFLGRSRGFVSPLFVGTRSISLPGFQNHLIFYRPEPDRVLIMRVLHGAMDPTAVFGPARWPRRSR